MATKAKTTNAPNLCSPDILLSVGWAIDGHLGNQKKFPGDMPSAVASDLAEVAILAIPSMAIQRVIEHANAGVLSICREVVSRFDAAVSDEPWADERVMPDDLIELLRRELASFDALATKR